MDQIELIDKRKPREKHFLQKDGTIRAEIYNTDIHYLKDGKYEEIDNTLVKENDSYVNKSNDYKVEFRKDIKKSLMKMSKDNYYIDFKLKEKKDNIFKAGIRKLSANNITYSDITDNIKVEYQALSNKVKETVVLQDSNYDELTFSLDTNLDLELVGGEIISKDENGNIIFKIEKPFMFDSNYIRNDNIYYLIEKKESCYELQLVLDDEWLKDKDRVYPVYVDPTISSNTENLNLCDTYIYPGDTNDNRGNLEILKAGVEKVNGQDRINRTLIKFDLPKIGTGYEIINAMLNIFPFGGERIVDYSHLIEVHRITEDWTENKANWNNMSDKYDSRVEDIEPFCRAEIINNKVHTYPQPIIITGLVKKWYEDTPNFGIMIKSCKETYINDNFPLFFSNNTLIEGNPKPVFVIQYRNKNGLENYWDYKNYSFTDGQAYVNTHTGNLTTIFNVGNTIGGTNPVSLGLVYNTNDLVLDNKTFFGNGFKLNLEQTIKKIDNSLQYLDEDGTIHFFYKNELYPNEENIGESDTYYDEDGLNLKVEDLGSTLKMTDSNNGEMIFTKIGEKYYLTLIKDFNNNTISIELNSNNSINKISDKYNSEITIEYTEENVLVHSSDGSQTKLNYNNNQLTSIESINGITTFNYNSKGAIHSIIDITGLKTEYEYYEKSPYKIKKITNYGLNNILGNICSFTYSLYETTIKDENGVIETIAFNDSGNVVSRNIFDKQDGIDDAYSIEKSYNEKNKLTSNMLPNKYVKNYLKNTSFESDEDYFQSEGEYLVKSYSTDEFVSGNRSLKVDILLAGQSIEQNVSLPKGNYYTFSGYFKNSESINILLSYLDKDGKSVIEEQNIEPKNEFEREDITIFYNEDATSDLKIIISFPSIGTVYIDDIQLEKGEVANCYNIIENSDFQNGLVGWNCSAHIDNNEVSSSDYIDVVNVNDSIKALRMKMQYNLSASVSKKFNIKGKKGESYTLSFWYKNEATIAFAPYVGSNISIFYEPYDTEDGHCILSRTLPITNGDSWQHFVYTDEAVVDFKSIQISFFNAWSANSFKMTNISFYKNVIRGEYIYDVNGKLNTIKSQDGKTITLNNNPDTSTSFSESFIKYEYAKDNPTKLLNTINSNGISNKISYNENGAMISSRVAKTYIKNLEDGLYCIRSKGTNDYIKAELFAAILEKNECSNTVWKLQKDGNYFKIIYSVQPSFSLTHKNGVIALDTSDTNNLFILEETNNGSYKIKYRENINDDSSSIRTLRTDGSLLKAAELDESDDNSEFYIEPLKELFVENDTEYTEDGRFIKKLIDSNFRKMSFVTNSTTGLIESVTDPTGMTIEYTYNNRKQVSSAKYGDRMISYEYNDKNMLKKIILDNKEFNINYNDFLQTSSISLGNNIPFAELNYANNNGNLLSTTYGNGDSILYEYDEFNRIKTIKRGDDTFSYKYNYKGDIVKIVSTNNVLKYNYDDSGKLNEYRNNEYRIKYTYDSNYNLVKKNYKLDNKEKSYMLYLNENDVPTSVKLENDMITYEVDNLNRVIYRSINNMMNTQYKYLSNGKRTSNVIEKYKFMDKEYLYKYDDAYNIKEIYCDDILIKSYDYDAYGELVNENNYDSNYKVSYMYDSSGNITQMKFMNINGSVIKVHNYNYDNENWKDQLTSFNEVNLQYDAMGNLTKMGNDNLTWINGTFLSSYTKGDNTISFNYDVEGFRKSKISNGVITKYFRDGNKIIYEKRDNNIIYFLYDLGELIGIEYNNTRYYYVKNMQNDILGIMDSNGNQIIFYKYDSWGNLLEVSDSDGNVITDSNSIGHINPFRYRGYYYDSETELYYLNSRYYCPKLGRFISPDKILGANRDILSYNLYAYVGNDPINHTDYLGNKKNKFGKWVNKQIKKAKKAINKAVAAAVKKVNNFVGKIFNVKTVGTSDVSSPDPFLVGVQGGVGHKTTISSVGDKNAPIKIEHDLSNSVTIQAGKFGVKVGDSFEIFTSAEKKDYTENRVWLGIDGMYLYTGLDREVQCGESETEYNTAYAHGKVNILVPVTIAVVAEVAIVPVIDVFGSAVITAGEGFLKGVGAAVNAALGGGALGLLGS